MKVEFKDTNFGPSLVVEISEFIKAKTKPDELGSLGGAVDSYVLQQGLDYSFSEKEYNSILSFVSSKTGNVHFYRADFQYPERHECFISIIQGNEVIDVRYEENSGNVTTKLLVKLRK